jgi:malonyl-CoA decarboxylase
MVNYLYDLGAIEANHERFVRGEVVCSSQIAATI